MSTEKTYLCDEYKLYFKIEDDVQILHNEVELYNTSFVGNNSFCHEEYIDGQRALTYSIPAMITMNQFITKKIHRDELVDIMFSITDQLMYLKANDMPLGKVILNIGYMYLNLEDMSVQLVFLPIDKPMEKCNMEKFVRDLINKLDFANKKASDCGYELIKFFDHNPSFYLSEFYKFITDMKNDNNVHPEDEQHFITRPQMAETVEENTEAPLQTTVVSTPSFKLAKEVKDYSGSDIGFDDDQVTDNNSVSRRHAYIINVNGVYYLRDNKSTNHTYLGGKIINSGTDMMLIDGSKFKLANEEFTFREK